MAGKVIPLLMIPEVANEFTWNDKEPSFKKLVAVISIIADLVSQHFPATDRVTLVTKVLTECRNWLHNNRKKFRCEPVGVADDDGYGQHDDHIEEKDQNKNEEKLAPEDDDSSDGTLTIAGNNTKTAEKDDSSEDEA